MSMAVPKRRDSNARIEKVVGAQRSRGSFKGLNGRALIEESWNLQSMFGAEQCRRRARLQSSSSLAVFFGMMPLKYPKT